MVLFRKKAEASDSDRVIQLMIVRGNEDTGDATGKIFDLQPGNNVMGRDALCEIRFNSCTVSRKHANLKVSYDKQNFTIIDLGSSNGVLIKPKTHLKNGKKAINSGDEFQIGEIVLKLVTIVQDDALQGHWHDGYGFLGGGAETAFSYGGALAGAAVAMDRDNVQNPKTDGSNGTPRTASESRPINAYVKYIIKT